MVQWLREERREGKDGKREGGVCVWERQTEACKRLMHHLLLYVQYVLSSEHTQIFHQWESSSRYIRFNLIRHTRQLFWTTWRDSLCNLHHARHTHTNKHWTKGRVYWASGQKTANLLLPFGSSHFQTPKSIHFTPPPPHQPQSTFAVMQLFNNHYILWLRPWYGVGFKGWKACCFLFSS